MLDLHCCAGFSLVASRNYSPIVMRELLLLQSKGSRVLSLQWLQLAGSRAPGQSCGAWLNCSKQGMWALLGPGMEPVRPALAGGFFTTGPPGKPQIKCLALSHGAPKYRAG